MSNRKNDGKPLHIEPLLAEHAAQKRLRSGQMLFDQGLTQALLYSDIDRRRWSIRLLEQGKLRALIGRSRGKNHGEFILFYPNGRIWMRGAHWEGYLLEDSLRFYLPNGMLAESSKKYASAVSLEKCAPVISLRRTRSEAQSSRERGSENR